MVEKSGQTPEEVIAQMKADMEAKYKKEREALAQKKKEERNAIRRMERKLNKEEQDKLGKVIYDTYGIKSVVTLKNEYEVVKKGKSTSAVQEQAIPAGMVLVPEEKMALIQSFYKETGEWCLQKQQEGGLKDTSVPNRVANFFREFFSK
ncbi:hypothetical protein [Jeotgalibaca caeni]|uniref:hypothetical protein n=1 Tax=Jeotgalibaca caeni TaxID=3028623 RepID=UPI00237DD2C3|nr:hypothetical protein [Jeotgalibaca caeni]MDE1548524.1 hypothetical protein [Jeotgalibaca caeni]